MEETTQHYATILVSFLIQAWDNFFLRLCFIKKSQYIACHQAGFAVEKIKPWFATVARHCGIDAGKSIILPICYAHVNRGAIWKTVETSVQKINDSAGGESKESEEGDKLNLFHCWNVFTTLPPGLETIRSLSYKICFFIRLHFQTADFHHLKQKKLFI